MTTISCIYIFTINQAFIEQFYRYCSNNYASLGSSFLHHKRLTTNVIIAASVLDVPWSVRTSINLLMQCSVLNSCHVALK